MGVFDQQSLNKLKKDQRRTRDKRQTEKKKTDFSSSLNNQTPIPNPQWTLNFLPWFVNMDRFDALVNRTTDNDNVRKVV